jgi:hypothetical protein
MTLAQPNIDVVPSTSDARPSDLPELLSWEEICHRYPNQWVLLIDTVHRDLDIDSGRVYAHDLDKHALVPAGHEAVRLYGHVGRFFTGHKRTWKFRSYAQRNV